MEPNASKTKEFTNATGQSILQIFTSLHYQVPGKKYEVLCQDRKNHHSLLHYMKQLMVYVLSTKFKQLLSTINLKPQKTLQSVLSSESLAILSNSFDLDHALTRAQEYNIPLLQVVILTPEGEATIKQKMLLHFRVAHFINQNFVLYGDWETRSELFKALGNQHAIKGEDSQLEGIYVRMGELIYAFIPMEKIVEVDDQVFEENLTKVRNLYYEIEDHSQATFSHLQSAAVSDFSASSSMFGPQRSYRQGQGDAFYDSDEEGHEHDQ